MLAIGLPDSRWDTMNIRLYTATKSIFPIALVMLVAMAVRLPLLSFFDVVTPDGAVLMEMAKTIASGDFFSINVPEHHHEPLYPALISIVSAATPLDYIKSGQIVSLSAALVTIYLVYSLAGRLYGKETGIYSALVLSLVPLHALSSVMVLKESLYVVLVVALIYSCALAEQSRGKAYFVMAGLFLGFAYLARFDGILLLFLIPYLGVSIDAGVFPDKKIGILYTAGTALIFYAAFASTLFFQTGELTISKKLNYYVTPVMATEASKKKILRDYGHEKGEEIIKSGLSWKWFLLKRTEGVYKGAHYMLPSVFPILLVLMAGAGIGAFRFGKMEMLLLLVPIIYIFILPYMKYPSDHRYFLSIVPFLSIFAGKGFALIQRRLAERNRYLPKCLVFVFLIVFVPWVFKPIFDGTTHRDALLQKVAGEYILDSKKKEKIRIVSAFPVVSFYAGAEHFYLGPLKKGAEIIGLIKETGADYVVLQDRGLIESLLAASKKAGDGIEIESTKEIAGSGVVLSVLKVRRN